MKFFRFLLTMFLIIATIIAVLVVKATPTISDEELLLMVHADEGTSANSKTTQTTNKTNDVTTIMQTGEMPKPTACPHIHTSINTINATCTEEGKQTVVCNDCGERVQEKIIAKLAHTKKTITAEATCLKREEIKTVCTVCNATLKVEYGASGCHSSLTLVEEKEPTPLTDGYRIQRCGVCKENVKAIIKFWQNGEVNLCIPSVKINCKINLGECNQTNTNNFDVTCDMGFIEGSNPLFFGHNTKTLGKLPDVKVGDFIYFTINGKTTVYKVTVSEEGELVNGETDIKGYKTQTSLITPCEKDTLHFFTCYPLHLNYSRWIVLAEKVDM